MKLLKRLPLIILLLLSTAVLAAEIGIEQKIMISQKTYSALKDLFKRENIESGKKKKREIYFLDNADHSFYKKNNLILRVRSKTKKSSSKSDITVKIRNLATAQMQKIISLQQFSNDIHSLKCEWDQLMTIKTIGSCSLKQTIKVAENNNLHLSTLQVDFIRWLEKYFKKSYPSLAQISALISINSISQKFKNRNNKKWPKSITLERWGMGNKKIYELSSSPDSKTTSESNKQKMIKLLSEVNSTIRANLQTKTKWAYQQFSTPNI